MAMFGARRAVSRNCWGPRLQSRERLAQPINRYPPRVIQNSGAPTPGLLTTGILSLARYCLHSSPLMAIMRRNVS
jgi:hypothetical protein